MTGLVTLGGRPLASDDLNYVPQYDDLNEMFTSRELLTYMRHLKVVIICAHLCVGGYNHEDKGCDDIVVHGPRLWRLDAELKIVSANCMSCSRSVALGVNPRTMVTTALPCTWDTFFLS